MYAKRVPVQVVRDLTDKPVLPVFEHEVQLLAVRYEGNVEVLEMTDELARVCGDVVELDVDEEWSRLEQVYGRDSDTGQMLVALVYGQFGAGKKALEKAGCKKPRVGKADAKPAGTAPDNDGNGYIKVDEIKDWLGRLAAEIPDGVTLRDDLLVLLDNTLIERLEEAGVEYDEGADTRGLLAALVDAIPELAGE